MEPERKRGASAICHQGRKFETQRINGLNCLLEDAEHRVYAAGEILAVGRQGQRGVGVFTRGTLRSFVCSPLGDGFTLGYLSLNGEVFRVGAVSEHGGDEFLGEALEDNTEVHILDWGVLEDNVFAYPDGIAALLLRLYQGWQTEIALSDQVLHPLTERVQRVLQRCAVRNGRHVVHHTLEDLARMVGATPTKVSREIAELDRQGLIHRVGRGEIEVPQPERLGKQRTG